MFGLFDNRKGLRGKLRRKPYRDAYVGEHVRRWIAHQIRALRDSRGWNQGEFSRRLGKPQSVVSRLEDASYGKMTINTLLEVASTLDVALLVRFVDYPTFLRQTADISTPAMQVESYSDASLSGVTYGADFVTTSYRVTANPLVVDDYSDSENESGMATSFAWQEISGYAEPAVSDYGRFDDGNSVTVLQ